MVDMSSEARPSETRGKPCRSRGTRGQKRGYANSQAIICIPRARPRLTKLQHFRLIYLIYLQGTPESSISCSDVGGPSGQDSLNLTTVKLLSNASQQARPYTPAQQWQTPIRPLNALKTEFSFLTEIFPFFTEISTVLHRNFPVFIGIFPLSDQGLSFGLVFKFFRIFFQFISIFSNFFQFFDFSIFSEFFQLFSI